MEAVPLDSVFQRRLALDFDVLEITDVQFDIQYLQKTIRDILEEHIPMSKDGYKKYTGLGLQYADAEHPIHNIEQLAFLKPGELDTEFLTRKAREYIHKNQLAKKMNMIFDTFKNINLFRGRILIASPGHTHAKHVDGKVDCRIHIPIFTNNKCIMHYDQRSFHLPANGKAYLCNTSRPHYFENKGTEDRVHIVFLV